MRGGRCEVYVCEISPPSLLPPDIPPGSCSHHHAPRLPYPTIMLNSRALIQLGDTAFVPKYRNPHDFMWSGSLLAHFHIGKPACLSALSIKLVLSIQRRT